MDEDQEVSGVSGFAPDIVELDAHWRHDRDADT